MWQSRRSLRKEILDLGDAHYTQEEYHHCLRLLCRVNRWLGGFGALRRAFREFEPTSVLEVGCGGGYLCQRLHNWFPKATIVGVDLSTQAIVHAKQHLPEAFEGRVSFQLQKNKFLDYPESSFDVVTALLVCHHMTDAELVVFLKESYKICSKAVIINDLHRHLLAYVTFRCIAPFLFPNRLIRHDGPLSIRRSFRKADWIALLEKAGFQKEHYQLRWSLPFRWTLTLRKP